MKGFSTLLREELDIISSSIIPSPKRDVLHSSLLAAMSNAFDKSTNMDSADQMHQVASSAIPLILRFFKQHPELSADSLSLTVLSDFQTRLAERATELHHSLRKEFLSGARGVAPASDYLGLTRRVYEFVRQDLGVKMHGNENLDMFPRGINADDGSIGQNISKIYEVRRPCHVDLLQRGNSFLNVGNP
jgi:phenylalanine ammonia-lyase